MAAVLAGVLVALEYVFAGVGGDMFVVVPVPFFVWFQLD